MVDTASDAYRLCNSGQIDLTVLSFCFLLYKVKVIVVPTLSILKMKEVNILKSLEWHPAHSKDSMLAVITQDMELSTVSTDQSTCGGIKHAHQYIRKRRDEFTE